MLFSKQLNIEDAKKYYRTLEISDGLSSILDNFISKSTDAIIYTSYELTLDDDKLDLSTSADYESPIIDNIQEVKSFIPDLYSFIKKENEFNPKKTFYLKNGFLIKMILV